LEPGTSSFGETHVSGDNATFFQAGQVVFPPSPPGPPPDEGPQRESEGRTRRVMVIAAVIGAAGAVIAAVIGGFFTLKANGGNDLEFRVSGHCDRPGAVVSATTGGFTPGGEYKVEVKGPEGLPYEGENAMSSGTVAPDGSVTWRWRCIRGTRPGDYRVRAEDVSSGDRTGWAVFRVVSS